MSPEVQQPLGREGEAAWASEVPQEHPSHWLPHAQPCLFELAHSTLRVFHSAPQPEAIPKNTICAAVIICSHLQFCTHKAAYKSQQGWQSSPPAEGLEWWGLLFFFLRAGTAPWGALTACAGQCSHRVTVGSGNVAPFIRKGHLSIQQTSTIPLFSPSPTQDRLFPDRPQLKARCWLALGKAPGIHGLTPALRR